MTTIDTIYANVGKWLPKISILVLLIIILTGCTPKTSNVLPNNNIKGQELDVTISNIDYEMDIITGEETSVIIESGGSILVTTAGSGSCPPIIEKVYLEDNVIKMYQKQYGNQPCTMDYRLYPQRITTVNVTNVFLEKEFMLCVNSKECFLLPFSKASDPTPV